MEQQYMTCLLKAYKRGYEKRPSTGSGTDENPLELKTHYFKVKENLPRVQVGLSFLHGIEEMLGKMTLPESFEARKVEWICV